MSWYYIVSGWKNSVLSEIHVAEVTHVLAVFAGSQLSA